MEQDWGPQKKGRTGHRQREEGCVMPGAEAPWTAGMSLLEARTQAWGTTFLVDFRGALLTR